jgi:TIGR03009 family protein
MTRFSLTRCCCLFMMIPAVAFAQTGAPQNGPSRYAPPAGAVRNAAPATQGAQYPARQTNDTQPIGQPIVQPGGVNPGPAVQPAIAPATPQAPEWAGRLTPEEIKWTDDVLRFWESRSDKVKLFECKFQRWDYDGGFVGPNQQRNPRTYSEGIIKYAQPDKGLYKVEKLVLISPGNAGGPPQQVVQKPEMGEHWICDGDKILSFEANKQQVTETPLPPEMKGKAIADGPLPFMFGAKAETIKARYWIHGLGGGPEGKYWLEAVPRSRQDAQNFKQVRIVLDKQDFLPESLEVFAPNYDPPRNDARQTYVFSNREAKDENNIKDLIGKGLDPFGIIRRDFFNPQIPFGWKKVVQGGPGNIPAGPQQPQQAGPAPPPRQPGAISR